MESFLQDRSFQVAQGPHQSKDIRLKQGVPQGSSLSPTLFNLYVAPVAEITEIFGVEVVSYADDTQLVGSLTQPDEKAASNFTTCLYELGGWMANNCLKLNGNKTEVLIVGKARSVWKSAWWPQTLGPLPSPCEHVRNLGVWLDTKISFEHHTRRVAGICFGIMRDLRKTLDLLPTTARKTMVHALVTSRLDYGNVLYLGAKAGCIQRLQRIQNAAACLVLMLPKRASSNKALGILHWLPIRERVLFKALCVSHRITQGKGPIDLHNLLTPHNPTIEI